MLPTELRQRVVSFLAAFLLLHGVVAAQQAKGPVWKTLNGSAPQVIAYGGFSGLFPDSSLFAYQFQLSVAPDSISWCDVQMTKDAVPVCLPNIDLSNCTNIAGYFPQGKKTYLIDGVSTEGWFPVDFAAKDLANVSLIQTIFSRTARYDNVFPILGIQDVIQQAKPSLLWLNIQHDVFYREHNLSMTNFVLTLSKTVRVNYISSPEVGFLGGIASSFKGSKTKLVFRFLDADATEPSTNQTYGSLLKNLTFIKTFASGVLVPKDYIWPVTPDQYLLPSTSIVTDAHKAGLEIHASNFANDRAIPYNYSFDPLAEALAYVDNGDFAVDGILTAFPLTPSAAVGCYSHVDKGVSSQGKLAIISHNGASGIYPDCTNLAYEQAVQDGADFIDCPVQLTQDGVLVCMSSVNLIDDTTVTSSSFRNLVTTIPELDATGIFTFNLTWNDIQENLQPVISSPEIKYNLLRNPRYKNAGSFTKLSDFLTIAKGRNLTGIFITVENAAFMAENLGFDVVGSVISVLNASGYDNQTELQIVIQSTNSSVLEKFKQQTKYKLNYKIDLSFSNADPTSLADIKSFADSVAIGMQSIYPATLGFITEQTGIVQALQSAGLAVYVYVLQNEYTSQAWDFFSDPYMEVTSFVQTAGVNGVITDYPATPRRYLTNTCINMGKQTPPYAQPVQVGGLLTTLPPSAEPPALAPLPVLDPNDVNEPPLPPVVPRPPPSAPAPASPPPSQPSSGPLCMSAPLFATLLLAFASFLIV